MATQLDASQQPPQAVSLDEFAGMTTDNMIGFYVALRDRIELENKAHAERMKPAQEKLAKLNAKMTEILAANGADSIKSSHGTVYKTMKKSATVSDKSVFRDFILNTHEFDLVDMRANAPAVEQYVAEHGGMLPPGVNYQQIVTVGVRRGTKKQDEAAPDADADAA